MATHEELRKFGKSLLKSMGISKILRKQTFIFENDKKYRIDLVGFKNGNDTDWGKSNLVLVEVGNNKYEKIHELRMKGFLVLVIPYDSDLIKDDIVKEYEEKF